MKLSLAIVTKFLVISRIPRIGLVAVLAGAMTLPAFSQAPEGRQRGTGEAPAAKDEQSVPIPPETNSVTKHDWSEGGRTIHYTATAGNLLIRDDQDKANGSIFYVAYTKDGVRMASRLRTGR